MHPLALAEAPVPTATSNTSNATNISLEPAGLLKRITTVWFLRPIRHHDRSGAPAKSRQRMDLGGASGLPRVTNGCLNRPQDWQPLRVWRWHGKCGLNGFHCRKSLRLRACAATNCFHGNLSSGGNFGRDQELRCHYVDHRPHEVLMNGLIYLIGLIVVIMAILSFLGLH